jgi:dTDP-4-amino-4,6-dideoxygalactose transaminase
MQPIQLVDLKGQYERIENEILKGIRNVLDTTAFINGPDVSAFANELSVYMGVPGVIPCANGTDALQIAMMALNLKPGDEIITPSFTYAATCEVIALLNLTPVFVECDPDTFNISPEAVEKAITVNTKAIIPVHLYGQCANMEKIMEIAARHNLHVIEDTAQAIGAEYTFSDGRVMKAGTIGTLGTTSFFPSKNLGCYGDGGAIFTRDEELAVKVKQIANHGQTKLYYHDLVGVNSRLDTIQAAILRAKLPHLDEYIVRRREAAHFYDEGLGSNPRLKIPVRASDSTHVFHQYTLTLLEQNRDEISRLLQEAKIPNKVYYPVPQHLQKAYNIKGYSEGDLPITENLCRQVISLPMHTELSPEQLRYIVDTVNALVK